jgi:peptidoglycan/xylan/chitin deacetylase (PgdA/CDA1 family)
MRREAAAPSACEAFRVPYGVAAMNDLLVICYHAIDPTWPADLSVTPAALEAQIAALARHGYRGVRFSDALSGGHQGRVVAITFDDSYRSVLELAKPILDAHGYPATVFVPTDWPGETRPMRWQGIDHWLDTPHEDAMRALDWRELGELADAGWEIGSHTCSHPHLPELDDSSLTRELTTSKARIETELGRPCTSLAYPYGEVDERVLDATLAAGYRWAGTIPRVLPRPRPLLWPRVPVYHQDDLRRFRSKVSPSLRRLRSSALGRSLDQARISWRGDRAAGQASAT